MWHLEHKYIYSALLRLTSFSTTSTAGPICWMLSISSYQQLFTVEERPAQKATGLHAIITTIRCINFSYF
ncbi:DNA-dependent RNA polymerase beta' subunit/160 kD subunit [Giardia duodenalis assemblage B]|uniref:DNA-dependent RNA polymerase beta' subunit/160 kD subunit n=1 Tax=Giardia duodenalis assemblage B TaxID=1394984 RepID=A0A132P0H2_GIAIN|nr:DNA-dependent RNA polymerase beta' subunit/160 kD subunit [Giardia intestinalis assemblage B]